MFAYGFMQRALIAIILLGIVLPMIGLNMTTKRLSMIGDTLSHTSLCGIAIGLAAGTMPIPWAIAISIFAGVLIEFVRNKFTKYSEITLSIVMSLAVGIAGILTSRWAAGNRIDSYLFGSLLIVTWNDIWIIIGVFVVALFFNIFFYRMIMYASYSEAEAQISGVPVKFVNMINIILVGSVVAVSSSIIGSLLVSSLLVIPVAASLKLFKSYRTTMISGIVLSLLSGISGLVLSYPLEINTGGTIVLFATALLVLAILFKLIMKLMTKDKVIKTKNEKSTTIESSKQSSIFR